MFQSWQVLVLCSDTLLKENEWFYIKHLKDEKCIHHVSTDRNQVVLLSEKWNSISRNSLRWIQNRIGKEVCIVIRKIFAGVSYCSNEDLPCSWLENYCSAAVTSLWFTLHYRIEVSCLLAVCVVFWNQYSIVQKKKCKRKNSLFILRKKLIVEDCCFFSKTLLQKRSTSGFHWVLWTRIWWA